MIDNKRPLADMVKTFRSGILFGNRYRFNKGEGLEKHAHDRWSTHCMIVARGSVLVRMPDQADLTIKAGGACDFGIDREHEIEALEDNTVIYNIINRYAGARYDPTASE
jgi:quercetin dioxygenase-like cupin family protein